jgi:DNA-directed RNA polymerase alpha subunit
MAEQRNWSQEPLSALGLSARTLGMLRRFHLTTVGQLCELTVDKILECQSFGMTSLQDLFEKLGAHGLRLKDGYPQGPRDGRAKTHET